ncbi:uncharacterized protein [Spinacia oleracea]|uniref:Endonuclease/exonuclease/phosphatase domain-containing protein n=1 Tax=Spinacia oleracea TaxID=3562 RepID=A0ABM3QQL2_SPIOL|nr:uncharacterized protein LOC130461519 [Spinacia oleracea]
MNTLAWNCRGIGNPRAVRALRNWCSSFGPDLLFISETKINKETVEKLKDKFGFDNAIGVSSRGLSGGLCMFWKSESVSFNLISLSQHHIAGDVVTSEGLSWRFIGLYEKKEGGADLERRAIPEFRDTLEACNLRDLGFEGQWFTWERGLSEETMGWSGKHFENLGKQIREVEKVLKEAQGREVSVENISVCLALEKNMDDLYDKQEAYWYLRSRVSDIKDGDRNTSYFHHKASQRRKRNEIKGLIDSTDEACKEVLSAFHTTITPNHNEALLKPFDKKEIFAAVCEMHPCKAPGPDGMHAIFYQKYWHIVGDDVSNHVCNILDGICSPEPVNNTNIILIPKVKSPTSLKEFRPIAL